MITKLVSKFGFTKQPMRQSNSSFSTRTGQRVKLFSQLRDRVSLRAYITVNVLSANTIETNYYYHSQLESYRLLCNCKARQ